jgi:hypothetical protein
MTDIKYTETPFQRKKLHVYIYLNNIILKYIKYSFLNI